MMLADVARRVGATFRTKAAMGLRPVMAPVMLFIPTGVLLGPEVSGVLSKRTLVHLDIVISIALATLGVFIGIAAGREGRASLRLLAAASLEACTTILVVATACFLLLRIWGVPLELPHGLVALALGVSASASAAPAADITDEYASRIAARVADLDDIVPILLGGVVLVAIGSGGPALESAALTLGLGLAIGVCGWLLVLPEGDAAERGLFVLGSLALLGGATAYLGLSPLLAGMAAGFFWVIAPGHCELTMARELRKVQRPLVVLLMIIAGAALVPTTVGIWLCAPYVVFRFAGKILGGWTATRVAAGIAPSDLGSHLIPPGVIGLAFALNVQQVAPDAATAIVFAVAVGAIACEFLALAVLPAGRQV